MGDNELREYYNRRAPEYEQIYYRDNPERQAQLAKARAHLQRICKGARVLDVPCGTGYWLGYMAQTAESIVAADASLEMLREARSKKLDCPVSWMQANLNNLPFERESFDVICLGFWYSHHPKQSYDDLYDELIPLLKPGGRIWMIDNNPTAEGFTHDPVGHDEAGNRLIRRKLSTGEEYIILKNYFSEKQLRELLEPRFNLIEYVYESCYWWVEMTPR